MPAKRKHSPDKASGSKRASAPAKKIGSSSKLASISAGRAAAATASTSSLPAEHFAAQLANPSTIRLTYKQYKAIFDWLERHVVKAGETKGWNNNKVDASMLPLAKSPDSAILLW